MYPAASFQLIIAMGIGTVLSKLLSLTGMTFPIYIGAMIAAACIRNLGEYGGKFTVYMGEINDTGSAVGKGQQEKEQTCRGRSNGTNAGKYKIRLGCFLNYRGTYSTKASIAS